MIENFNNPADLELLLLGAMAGQSNDELIGSQEKRGQQQLVNSDRLPTEIRGDRAEFEALGFTLGDPDPADPLFAPATLPAGWTREASDHDMWSYILDELGRRRVAVFYKAAFYDRSAGMSLVTLHSYLQDHLFGGRELICDDTWATPAALADEARHAAQQAQERASSWEQVANQQPPRAYSDQAPEYAAKYAAERDQYAALAARFEAEAQQP
ncbi:hypothetical protein AW27_026420 [Streptomyces sp. PCS3-D2]|uniref:hypothetical protein n=1 Tax=Streptomyces sp. PCS3-D2 TaxID=1460244 RepID=UPI000446D5D4|nr:hypothetical protein [Streptomyces sp. PCS3-D2]WKV74743.1 hypothetical protein AW27_026420 [Streptomyces sp. PCS3-D2]